MVGTRCDTGNRDGTRLALLPAPYVAATGNTSSALEAVAAARCRPPRGVRRLLCVSLAAGGLAQPVPVPGGAAPTAQTTAPAPAVDPLGRSTPRGTVWGFLHAARKGELDLARQYLDTRLGQKAAEELAHHLFVVLDARLPARLTQISDVAEGSRANPQRPDQDHVVQSPARRVRWTSSSFGFVPRTKSRSGSSRTQRSTRFPGSTRRSRSSADGTFLPSSLSGARLRGVRIVEWLVVLLAIPIAYFATVLLNRLLVPLAQPIWRRMIGDAGPPVRSVLPVPARLLLLCVLGNWLLSFLSLSLLVRQFWSSVARTMTIVAVVWLLLVISAEVERAVRSRVPPANAAAASSLLRLSRRAVELLIVFAGLLAMLRHFGVDPTPALAGLGVGGIAVALAAQKTLENVIAGASLIFDQAVRVGDFLKMGEIAGTVDHIGLRSTRIRTLDRTVVSVPNGQIANAALETISARDKFWFHPVVSLRYDTTLGAAPRRHRRSASPARAAGVRGSRVRTSKIYSSRSVLPRRRGLHLPLLAGLESFPGAPGTTALRHYRDRRTGRHRHRLPVADDVRSRCARRAGEASHRTIPVAGGNAGAIVAGRACPLERSVSLMRYSTIVPTVLLVVRRACRAGTRAAQGRPRSLHGQPAGRRGHGAAPAPRRSRSTSRNIRRTPIGLPSNRH